MEWMPWYFPLIVLLVIAVGVVAYVYYEWRQNR